MLKFLIIGLLLKYVNLSDVSYYEVLGVSKQATLQEIRQAYKKLAVKLHPDKNSDSKEQKKFLEITEAYETLKDANKKRQYDLYVSQQSYTRRYDYHSQSEYNNLYYNGLYHDDPFVKTLSREEYYKYLNDGLYFINFYSPFCPPCQSLADDWKKLAEAYKEIVNIAAVNCKYHNSFCYNNMRIGRYPSLYFYPNGKHGNYIYYNGAHTYEALEKFVMKYVNSKININHINQVRSTDEPVLYILDEDRLDDNVLTRVAFHLNGLATIAIPNTTIRKKLSDNDEAIFVFKYKQTHKEITSLDEDTIIEDVVDSLPKVQNIGLNNLKTIRNNLRNGEGGPWVLFFYRNGDDKLLLHQTKAALTEMKFGEVNCDENQELCTSFQVERTPDWSVLKVGGAFQRVAPPTRRDLRNAAAAHALHTLSAADARRIFDGDMSTWVLLVSPYGISWEHLNEPFTEVSLELGDTGLNFGILSCTLNTDKYCREVTESHPVILVQNGTDRHVYNGHAAKDDIIEFIQLLKESSDLMLTEEDVLDLVHRRSTGWLVAFLPKCGATCDRLLHEMRIVARRSKFHGYCQQLKSLTERVGVLSCGNAQGFCSNVRAPVLRYYPPGATHLYSVNLQNLSEAPYILEWALEYINPSVTAISWETFANTVISEELNPSSTKKPWLVYFHSPRCYHCYDMYPDFAIGSILLKDKLQFGKVNCVSERSLCQHERISSYPSLRLYLSRDQHSASRVIVLQPKHYLSLLRDLRPHIKTYDDDVLQNIQNLDIKSHIRDEL